MKKLAKVLTLLLALALICGTLAIIASAEGGPEAKIGSQEYDTVAGAFAEAADGATVTLAKNASVAADILVQKNLTLDLNGYTLDAVTPALFNVDGAVTLNVIGTGVINLQGTLVSAPSQTEKATINVIGSAGTAGIDINFSAILDDNIITAYQGDVTVKNVDLSILDLGQGTITKWTSFFDTIDSVSGGVNWNFSAVKTSGTFNGAGVGHVSFVDIMGNGTLTVNNSTIVGPYSFANFGTVARENNTVEFITINNSYISAEGALKQRQYVFDGYPLTDEENNAAGVPQGPIGAINVKNSYLASSTRIFCGTLATDCVITLENSTVSNTGATHKDPAHQITRGFDLVFKAGSKLDTTLGSVHSVSGAPAQTTTFEIGSRASNKNKITYGTLAEGTMWVYDVKGDANYPWVVVAADGNTTVNPDWVILNNMEDVIHKHVDSNYKWEGSKDEVKTLLVNDGSSNYSVNQFNNLQWGVKAGNLYKVKGAGDNTYIEYEINPVNDSETRSLGTDPFFVFGTGYKGGAADVNSYVAGDNRRKVMVASVDFGYTSEYGYPEINIGVMSRGGSGGSNLENTKKFNLTNDGTLKNNLNDAHPITLRGRNEWNRIEAVAYTDPAFSGGIAYIYVNGQYAGYTTFYKDQADDTQTFFMGIRFNIEKTAPHIVNSNVVFDNTSVICYNDYLGATECDSTAGTQDGVRTPEIYLSGNYNLGQITNYGANVSGIEYENINEAIKDASAAGTIVELSGDVTAPTTVTEDGIVYTNGYTINLAADSNAAKITTDDEGNVVSYEFKELYNAYYLTFLWLKEGCDPESQEYEDYVQTTVNVGRLPEAPHTFASVPNWENNTLQVQVGWDRDLSGEAWEFAPVTLGEAGTSGDEYAIMTPVFEEVAMTSYVKNANGYVSYQTTATASFSAYQNLKDGETLVLLADMPVNKTTTFSNEGAQYTGGVTIDGDYTAEELATMREASVKIYVDLNGFKMINDTTGSNIARVGLNTTLTVYSSKPGAEIFSAFNAKDSSGKYYTNGQRMFTIYNGGGEDFNSHDAVYNGHIVLGTYGEYPGSNLTLKGGVILEGLTGDNSTSIEADGLTMICVSPTSGGTIMTRYYSGDIIVTNSLVLSPGKANIIDMKAYYASGSKPSDMSDPTSGRSDKRIATPYVYFENCILINTAGEKDAIIGNNGDGTGVCLVFKNVYTSGRLNPSNIGDYRVRTYENVASTNFALGGAMFATDEIDVAIYNQPLTMNAFGVNNTDANYLQVDMHTVDGATGAVSYTPYYIVTAGNESLVTEEGATIRVLGTLNMGTALKTDIVTVTYAGLTADAEPAATVNYLKGAPYTAADITPADVSLGATKLVFDGTWSAAPEFVTENVTLTPGVAVKANIEGVLANLSIYSDFNVNLFVPIAYKDAITSIAVGETVLATVEVDMDGDGVADYIKVTYKRACNEANTNVVFTITVGDVACTATVNIAEYAKTILAGEAYTAEDKQLMYYMAAYANEAYKYFGDGTADETLAGILTTYESAKGEYVADETYANAIADTKLGDAFASATIDLASAPRFVLTLKDGFAGTVTVTYGPNTFTKTVTATDDRVIVIDGMKAYNFCVTLDVTAEGTIGETAVTVAGNYNLDTFVKYHADNAATNEDSAKCLALLKAFYDYVAVANAYKA